jgi:hypothetical protein
MASNLPLDGWRRRSMFLEKHPSLQVLVPNLTSLDWVLRSRREELSPYLRRHGREVLIHDQAADVLPDLLLKPIN